MNNLESLIIDYLLTETNSYFLQREQAMQRLIERIHNDSQVSEGFISTLMFLKFQIAKQHRDFVAFILEQSRNANPS